MSTDKLSITQRLGYGVCCFGTDIFFQAASFFLLFYYTDVLGLSASAGGAIYMIALAWDGLIDPFVGQFANRTRSRFGRYRPFILYGAIPLALSYTLIFWPNQLVGTALFMWALFAHMLFRTAYAFVSIPFGALSAQLTDSSSERSVLAGFRVIFATLAGLLVAVATQPLVHKFGGGDLKTGYFNVALLYGALAIIAFGIAFLNTRERVQSDVAEPSFSDGIRMLKNNRPFWLICGAIVLASLGGTMFTKALLYFCKYNLGDETLNQRFLANIVVLVALLTPFWALLSKRWGKRTVWLLGSGLCCAGMIIALTSTLNAGNLLWVVRLYAAGFAALAVMFWSIIPDTVEYGQWRSKVRAEGMIFGFVALAQKVALGLGVGLLGLGLDWSGFQANATQTTDALAGIQTLMAAGPLIGVALSALVMWFYRLDSATHARMVSELNAAR